MTIDEIREFRGPWYALSNFSRYPTWYDGVLYPTSEHAFIAAKTTDPAQRAHICAMTTSEAKVYGRNMELRSGWDKMRGEVMITVLREKFWRNPEAADILRRTGDATLIEGNTWHDNFWGDCTCTDCAEVVGHNFLGKLLMAVRAELNGTSNG